jgi:uncharacterized protein
MLIDASAMVNIIDRQQPRSAEFRTQFQALRPPAVTTWAAFAEAMSLLAQIGGWSLQCKLWELIQAGLIRLHFADETEQRLMAELMEQYQYLPMGLADASLAAASETLSEPRILTQDSNFYVYQRFGHSPFEVVP